jgi:hypothetical protein
MWSRAVPTPPDTVRQSKASPTTFEPAPLLLNGWIVAEPPVCRLDANQPFSNVSAELEAKL